MIRSYSVLLAVALSIGACAPQSQLKTVPFGEWHHAGGNHFSAKYSPWIRLIRVTLPNWKLHGTGNRQIRGFLALWPLILVPTERLLC